MMEPTIHLRQAKVGDIPAILEIEQECFQEDSFLRTVCLSDLPFKGHLLCGSGTGADDRLCLIIVSCGNPLSADIFDSRPSGLQRKEAGTVAHGADD